MEEWMQHVKSAPMSGNLTLKDLSTDHNGIYTCELRNAEGTYVTNTFLKIEHSQASARSGEEIAGIVVGVVGVVVALSVLAAGLVVLFKQRRTKKGRRESHGNDCELKPFNSQLKTSNGSNGGLTEDDPLKVISSSQVI
ncbi:hypothetical protein CgunFtcFv8_027661 [Champsocephalus gunnari]|uniref:Uncharacterized protein n=1 Tax=Champsocephalus gunnari TaxID=52237 RepID=A0AAN8EKL6_CHAGU|nr:hypothetical protein CgunFtcFv8_027661 [Champsocephalus gunnari]